MVERCEVEYKVDGAVIPMVSSYKYLGCVADEHLELKEMVEEKAAAGRRALSAWLYRCKAEVGDVGVQPLLKAMNGVGEDFLTKPMETEQPFIITCMYRNYTFYLSLTLCGQLGSSNQSALFMHYHH